MWSDPLFEGFDPREIVALNNELQGFESSSTDTLIADEMETIDHSLSQDLVSIGVRVCCFCQSHLTTVSAVNAAFTV